LPRGLLCDWKKTVLVLDYNFLNCKNSLENFVADNFLRILLIYSSAEFTLSSSLLFTLVSFYTRLRLGTNMYPGLARARDNIEIYTKSIIISKNWVYYFNVDLPLPEYIFPKF